MEDLLYIFEVSVTTATKPSLYICIFAALDKVATTKNLFCFVFAIIYSTVH